MAAESIRTYPSYVDEVVMPDLHPPDDGVNVSGAANPG